MMDQDKPKKQRGGARPGAGRKPSGAVAATKVMRVPDQYVAAVRALIDHLDSTQHVSRHLETMASSPVFMHSLQGHQQHLTFITTGPVKEEDRKELGL